MANVSGVVEQVGTRFNGSVKVGGKFYNFKKGTDYSLVSVGDMVNLTLKDWEFEGKTGQNVIKVDVVDSPKPVEAKVEPIKAMPKKTETKGRDFDAEARGKTRCSTWAAAVQSPALAQFLYTKEASLEDIKGFIRELAEDGTKFTFGE